jgi:DNA-binding NarL/FixJ family response regulator
MSTVLICDDAEETRDALRDMVAGIPGVDEVTGVGTGEEVLARWARDRPDLLLLDLRMPGMDGLETCRRLVALHPEAGVVVTTMAEDPEGVARAVAAGAMGYVAKDATRDEMAAVLSLALPEGRVGAAAAVRSTDGIATPEVVPETTGPVVGLTERERQVLDGMARGRSNAQIGAELFLSEDTIKTHARRLFRKLAAHDRAHAVAEGFRHGLLV